MINLDSVRTWANPGDIILTGGDSFLSRLIRNGQRIQTTDGKPSRYSHVVMYVDSMTIAESTMDYDPYIPTGKRLDNGPQFNDLDHLSRKSYGTLFCLPITNDQRQKMLDKARGIIDSGAYRYDITGLVGSLLTYYLMPWMHSNPLSAKHQMYCSAFISILLNEIGLDPCENTDRNTSHEQLHRWLRRKGVRFIEV